MRSEDCPPITGRPATVAHGVIDLLADPSIYVFMQPSLHGTPGVIIAVTTLMALKQLIVTELKDHTGVPTEQVTSVYNCMFNCLPTRVLISAEHSRWFERSRSPYALKAFMCASLRSRTTSVADCDGYSCTQAKRRGDSVSIITSGNVLNYIIHRGPPEGYLALPVSLHWQLCQSTTPLQ
ncbi:hypothetical protein J6590_050139 [Homalodisca vitripennis]|nr:hypothetical protein J6590_050139 [Homalodisca vitripennis]